MNISTLRTIIPVMLVNGLLWGGLLWICGVAEVILCNSLGIFRACR